MLFKVGRIRVAREVLECDAIEVSDLVAAFGRYIKGDWGKLDPAAQVRNDVALASGEPIRAVYESVEGREFWITTAVGTTTVRLPHAPAEAACPSHTRCTQAGR
ncbi:MAG: hypothetical protein IRZ33_04940 [Alicyclobacillaceae bacterium]|nr:hypothetical protein [Alicyclobacillaceae bacterium]